MGENADRLAASTHANYILSLTDVITEEAVLFYMFKKRGKIKYGKSGTDIQWRVFKE